MLLISAIPAFRDNYIWALHGPASTTQAVVLVDPGEAEPILTWLTANQAVPVAVLITHHHGDHTGAVETLAEHWNFPIYGPRKESIAGITNPVEEGDVVRIEELGLAFDVLETPGHTLGHVCYYGDGKLFSGDTLFSCGCGRLFEGTAAQMHASLNRLSQLPPETQVYCAHEYTLPNIGFAQEVEPDNADLAMYYQSAKTMRRNRCPTLPSNMAQELACNPFLRCHLPGLNAAMTAHTGHTLHSAVDVFAALRRWKDDY